MCWCARDANLFKISLNYSRLSNAHSSVNVHTKYFSVNWIPKLQQKLLSHRSLKNLIILSSSSLIRSSSSISHERKEEIFLFFTSFEKTKKEIELNCLTTQASDGRRFEAPRECFIVKNEISLSSSSFFSMRISYIRPQWDKREKIHDGNVAGGRTTAWAREEKTFYVILIDFLFIMFWWWLFFSLCVCSSFEGTSFFTDWDKIFLFSLFFLLFSGVRKTCVKEFRSI